MAPLKKHPRRGMIFKLDKRVIRIFDYMKLWGKNARVFVATEILFAIFMSWVELYRAIFMGSLGFDEFFIGFVLMLPLILQIFLPIIGGYLADLFGRKKVLMFFDSIGWIGSTAVWIIARDSIHVMVAALLQGLSTTIYGVWETLLVEDTEPQYRASIYSTIQTMYSPVF
ncbi:MAG: MFS transporter [Thermoproteota archaeon]